MKIDCPMIVQFEECFMLAVVPFKLWLSIESWKFQQRLNAWFCLILNLHKPLHQFWNISPLQKGLILSITWLESLMLFYDSHSFCLLFLIFFKDFFGTKKYVWEQLRWFISSTSFLMNFTGPGEIQIGNIFCSSTVTFALSKVIISAYRNWMGHKAIQKHFPAKFLLIQWYPFEFLWRCRSPVLRYPTYPWTQGKLKTIADSGGKIRGYHTNKTQLSSQFHLHKTCKSLFRVLNIPISLREGTCVRGWKV